MTGTQVVHGVYLSDAFDLEKVYGFALKEKGVRLHGPEDLGDRAQIAFAICWLPKAAAFDPDPNLSVAMSIGAGVDARPAAAGHRPCAGLLRATA